MSEKPPVSAVPEAYPVHQITRALRELIDADTRFRSVWVEGEVQNLSKAPSGHIYFTLTEGGTALQCAFFRNRNSGQHDRLETGLSVLAHGAISLYEKRGDLQLVVDLVQPAGEGAAAAEFERRRLLFEKEGLFDLSRKRVLPRFPRRIAIVTSPQGAVLHDVQTVLARRWPFATLLVQPTVVQGAEAGGSIAAAIRAAAQPRRHNGELTAPPEVMIVARGGGAAEDLWAFNEEQVVRAIFGCPVPVVSAIGHETDNTLADLVADKRASTPSVAAELVTPDRRDLVDHIQNHHERIDTKIASVLETLRTHIHEIAETLLRSNEERVTSERNKLNRVNERIKSLSPLATLDRGYAIISRPDGSAVTNVGTLVEGERLSLRLRDGTRGARVESPP